MIIFRGKRCDEISIEWVLHEEGSKEGIDISFPAPFATESLSMFISHLRDNDRAWLKRSHHGRCIVDLDKLKEVYPYFMSYDWLKGQIELIPWYLSDRYHLLIEPEMLQI